MPGDIAGTTPHERVIVDAMPVNVEREKSVAILVRPIIAEIDHRSAVRMATARRIVLRMLGAFGLPPTAGPMNVVGATLDQTERIGIVVLAVHALVTRAWDHM